MGNVNMPKIFSFHNAEVSTAVFGDDLKQRDRLTPMDHMDHLISTQLFERRDDHLQWNRMVKFSRIKENHDAISLRV